VKTIVCVGSTISRLNTPQKAEWFYLTTILS